MSAHVFVYCRNKRALERSIRACISHLQFAINCGEVPVIDPQEYDATVVKPAERVARFKFSGSPPQPECAYEID